MLHRLYLHLKLYCCVVTTFHFCISSEAVLVLLEDDVPVRESLDLELEFERLSIAGPLKLTPMTISRARVVDTSVRFPHPHIIEVSSRACKARSSRDDVNTISSQRTKLLRIGSFIYNLRISSRGGCFES